MKKAILTIIVILFAVASSFAQGQVHVRGYYRSNGTYVQSHYRTASNNTVSDNWSTVGNTNPYTGQAGTRYISSNFSSNNYNRSKYRSYPSSTSYRVTSPVRTYRINRTYSHRSRY